MSMEQSAASSQSQTDLNTDDIKAEFITLLNTLSCIQISNHYDF